MTADEDAPGHVELNATASDHARIYQAGHNQYFTNVTQVSSRRPPVPAAAPAGPEHLVGRQEKVDELLTVLAPGPATVVTGLPGIGKTALALHTAHQAAERGLFPGGVLYVTLRGYDPTGPVTAQRSLGILLRQLEIPSTDLPGEVEELAALYQSELTRRAKETGAILIVADDASSTTQLMHLVPAHRAHRLLVTSRDILTSPTFHARLIRLNEPTAAAAAEIIRGAVTLQRPDDPRLAADPQALGEVVAHCGRLPLALQIAAALLKNVPSLSVAALAEDLADTLNALQFRSPDGEQSLAVRAAFDLSYRRLAPEAARVFRLLGLCVGPDLATDSAAALTDRPVRDTLHTLTTIANTSLLAEEPLGSGRWRMHDLIRLYTAELAAPRTEEDLNALKRLLHHYTSRTDAADNHLSALPGDRAPAHFDNRAQALAWLDAEHSTLTATIVASQQPRATFNMAFHVQQFLRLRRHFDDAITIAEHTLTTSRNLGDRHREGAALSDLGLALRAVRRFDEAIDAHTHDLAICRELGNHRNEGKALTNLGLALQEVRRFDEAIDAHTKAAAIFAALGDRHSAGGALNNLGLALQEVRRFQEAIDAHTHDLAICRDLGDQHREGGALNNLGTALRAVRRFQEAIDAHTKAAAIYRELGDRHSESQALNNLGLALRAVRRFQEAIDAHTRAAAIYRELGDHYLEGTALNNLGIALQEVGRFEEAIDAHTKAAAIFTDLGDRHNEGAALNNLGTALQEMGRFEEAIDAHTQAATIWRDLGDRHGESGALSNLGSALQGLRRFEEAIDPHTRAAAIFADLGDRHSAGGALTNLGLALQEVGRFEEAIDAHTKAAAIFTGLGDRHNEELVRRNLAAAKAATGWWGRLRGRGSRS